MRGEFLKRINNSNNNTGGKFYRYNYNLKQWRE